MTSCFFACTPGFSLCCSSLPMNDENNYFLFLKDFISVFYFFKDFIYLFLERGKGREKERERNINVWLPLTRPLLGTWPATLTGNWTAKLLFHGPAKWSIYWATPDRAENKQNKLHNKLHMFKWSGISTWSIRWFIVWQLLMIKEHILLCCYIVFLPIFKWLQAFLLRKNKHFPTSIWLFISDF